MRFVGYQRGKCMQRVVVVVVVVVVKGEEMKMAGGRELKRTVCQEGNFLH
jgi:hypothetical protein